MKKGVDFNEQKCGFYDHICNQKYAGVVRFKLKSVISTKIRISYISYYIVCVCVYILVITKIQ